MKVILNVKDFSLNPIKCTLDQPEMLNVYFNSRAFTQWNMVNVDYLCTATKPTKLLYHMVFGIAMLTVPQIHFSTYRNVNGIK